MRIFEHTFEFDDMAQQSISLRAYCPNISKYEFITQEKGNHNMLKISIETLSFQRQHHTWFVIIALKTIEE